ncbi:YihY/virulence factor BrkB family protein [Devosia sp.]|uniref:YihY/virulence factor BrkB family protein n=1 Tax=Devosia sp. TaxID=1871048 RepID=UPI0019F4BC7B|nr:YihY/virulence factor BrkB family protein [Devosia sp.]MBE0579172.1 YihY/virulence factor BrkB family protein [Devosia sp.]
MTERSGADHTLPTEADRQNARQVGRGRRATDPTDIPGPGRLDILWRLYRSIAEDRIMLTAAGVAFYVLLALVPALTAVVSIYGLFNNPSGVIDQVEMLRGIVPPGVLETIRDQLVRLTRQSNNTLGLALVFSLVLALWSASAGVKAMFEALNIAYGEEEKRSFLHLNAMALLFTLGGAVAACLVVGVLLLLPAVIMRLPGGEGLEWAVRVASYGILMLVVLAVLAALYRWGPSRQAAKWRWITPGVILTVALFGAVSAVFSWYVANFTDNNATYGSLGATIGLMTWLWITMTLVIIGAEVNSEIEHQTARDSTTGPEEPLGQRGAQVADSVGSAWPRARKKLERPLPQDEPRPKRLSWTIIAFAAPAALALHLATRRRK